MNTSDQPENADMAMYCKNVGIPVNYAESFYLHAKLIVSDGIAFVGSENMSPTSFAQNREVGALVFEPTPVVAIQQQFDAGWASTTPAP
jgi:phosphatidylserine/phosphatidylglycerophosphate/cardiolipin synthase-like enzyme